MRHGLRNRRKHFISAHACPFVSSNVISSVFSSRKGERMENPSDSKGSQNPAFPQLYHLQARRVQLPSRRYIYITLRLTLHIGPCQWVGRKGIQDPASTKLYHPLASTGSSFVRINIYDIKAEPVKLDPVTGWWVDQTIAPSRSSRECCCSSIYRCMSTQC